MSYKFNLDHTLAIADIHDMITIDIKPETRCSVTGGDIEIHGYLTFRGSYLTPDLEEAPFEGSVPLDITLPYLGGAPDVKPEIVSFDYDVENKKTLTLNLEVSLRGYNDYDRDAVMDAWIDPVVEEPVYEEAIIEPFDFDTTPPIETIIVPKEAQLTHREDTSISTKEVPSDESVMQTEIPHRKVEEMPVHGFEEVPVHELKQEVAEEIPYSPLIDIEESRVEIEEVVFEPAPVEEAEEVRDSVEVVETVETLPMDDEDEVVEPEVVERSTPKLSASAAALMDELFSMKRGSAFKEAEVVPSDEVILDATEIDDQSAEVVVEVDEKAAARTSDTIAHQFADGETTIKMVYVEDEDTLGGVLDRYTATLDDVWNLTELADGLTVGDCVMLRYEKTN